jgi:REP element-mobilizing transposase RayT
MTRELRADHEPGVHHVWARGNGGQTIFLSDADRHRYLSLLGSNVERCDWSCLAYCLMGNHVHLMIETRRPNLSDGMQRLHGRYALEFNRRHKTYGHLFQGRFGSNRMQDEPQLLTTLAYVELNPVEAGLCAQPRDWPWSSSGALARGTPPRWLDIARVYEYLASRGGDPRARYRELLASPRT